MRAWWRGCVLPVSGHRVVSSTSYGVIADRPGSHLAFSRPFRRWACVAPLQQPGGAVLFAVLREERGRCRRPARSAVLPASYIAVRDLGGSSAVGCREGKDKFVAADAAFAGFQVAQFEIPLATEGEDLLGGGDLERVAAYPVHEVVLA